MILVKSDDQVLEYYAYQRKVKEAFQDVERFFGFYEKWREA
jgi:hypothetical protein